MKKPQSTIHFFKTSPYDKQGRIRCWVREQYKPTWADVGRDIIKALGQRVRSRTARKSFASLWHAKERAVSILRWLTSPLLVIALVLYIFYPRTGDVVYAQHIDTFSPAPAMVETKPIAPITTAPALPQVAELPMPPPPIAEPGAFSNTYVAGQCTWGIASRVHIPNNWGNANQWAASATAAGWSVGTVPKYGAIAVSLYDSPWGHVALVIDNNGTIWEENGAYGPFTSDTRAPNPGEFQYYIYPSN